MELPFTSPMERTPTPPMLQLPGSPDSLLLEAWRRAEATSRRLEAATPAPPTRPPVSASPAVDRVLTDALHVQISRAEARADTQSRFLGEQRVRTAQLEAELEAERDASARLREEIVRFKARQHEDSHQSMLLTRALKEAQADAAALRKERDHWYQSTQQALLARDAAVHTALGVREMLVDTPGYLDGAAAALLRAQVVELNSKLHGGHDGEEAPAGGGGGGGMGGSGMGSGSVSGGSVGGGGGVGGAYADSLPFQFSWEMQRQMRQVEQKATAAALVSRVQALEQELAVMAAAKAPATSRIGSAVLTRAVPGAGAPATGSAKGANTRAPAAVARGPAAVKSASTRPSTARR